MKNLHVYLNDHLAGSVGALEFLDRLIANPPDPAFSAFITKLREEIDADQIVLRDLLQKVHGDESAVRKAGAWVAEKLSRLKFPLEADDRLGLFEALEGLSLGITGKRSLWRTLRAASESIPALRSLDYDRLERRAAEQFEKVEAQCLQLAPTALGG